MIKGDELGATAEGLIRKADGAIDITGTIIPAYGANAALGKIPLFGDILTDEGAGLVGGLGLAPGICVGYTQVMAQATHGSAPDIAGKNIANPYAMIMSGQMLMEWLGRKHAEPKAVEAAQLMDKAIDRIIRERKSLTGDLGGKASTSQMGDAIAAAV